MARPPGPTKQTKRTPFQKQEGGLAQTTPVNGHRCDKFTHTTDTQQEKAQHHKESITAVGVSEMR